MQILFVNACVRGKESNTLKLCNVVLEDWKRRYPEATFSEVNLEQERPQPLYAQELVRRDALRHGGALIDPMFRYAHQFAQADKILIGAPYWDLSFPAALKIYLELISVVDISFAYTEQGQPKGLCRADELLYITTSGGPVGPGQNMGYDYVRGLCQTFYGVQNCKFYGLHNLETGVDIAALVEESAARLREALSAGTL